MAGDDTEPTPAVTRRTALESGAALAAGGALAGCSDLVGSDSAGSTRTDGTYSVTMSPTGTVEFDAVPDSVFTVFPQYADMAVALGHGDALDSVYVPEMSGTTMNHYYHHLDGVSLDWSRLADPLRDGLSKESVIAHGSDVHLADPVWAANQDGWDENDVEEVSEQVGPWVGNFYSGTHADPPSGGSDYEYYGLWDLFGTVASVFRERDRYEALASVRSEMLAEIESNLPPEDERPTAVRVTYSGDAFWTYHLNKPGYWLADTRPLGARDAFAERDWGQLWGEVGWEAMAEADPDVILHLWGLTPNYDMAEVRSQLQSHSIGQELGAVSNGRVYPQGMRYQGPIMNLFQTEMTAKQLYPDRFGEWPAYADGDPYPEIPSEEQLFDRERVAAAIRGEV
ncbi:ABC transporter substrate-binding protein [Halorientalis pallida]|uniref:ABC transporter substrate-binding protein n=1 Tax=Halorientalis pallida TaxID=2479928 RepID=UPI003C6F2366